MELLLSVGLRSYPERGLYIAHTLEPPEISVAAATEEDALTSLRDALAERLRLSHPQWSSALGSRFEATCRRLARNLYRVPDVARTPSAPPDETPIDVVRRRGPGDEGPVELALPLYGRRAWATSSSAEEVLEALLDELRDISDEARLHRVLPTGYRVERLSISFQPLDLRRVPAELLWQRHFDPDDLVSEKQAAATRAETPTLEEVASCWSCGTPEEADARGLELCFGRTPELRSLRELLDAERPLPVLLVGPTRVGKTALVRHIAREQLERNLRRESPGQLAADVRQIWFADGPRICATDPMSTGWQQQARQMMGELEEADDILYLGRALEALDAGKYVGSDYNLAQFLEPLLADHRARVVAEATPSELERLERRNAGFARTFQVVRIESAPPSAALEAIVRPACERHAEREGIRLGDHAVERAWELQRRFATEGSPAGRTIDFMRRALRRARNTFREEVDAAAVVAQFCEDSGMPEIMLRDDRTLSLERVRETLARRVRGQDEAIARVADVIGITKAGLADPDRPLGSFLFVGPTGVGKTELARALAEYLFGDEERMVRLDMSEYTQADGYARLIGEDRRGRGDLTEPLRRTPFTVVLLDEIEKAHPSVFDLLLQVLGEARLTDARGRTVSFRNAIVIMTSNLGVASLGSSIGFGAASDSEERRDAYAKHFRREAEKLFRPEFLARLDQIIPFAPLHENVLREIARRELDELPRRDGLFRRDVRLEIGDGVAGWLARRGHSERYGARPLQRVVEREVVWPIARQLSDAEEEDDDRLVTHTVRIDTDPGADDPMGADLVVTLETAPVDSAAGRGARRALLARLERAASLRRRLQRRLWSGIFGDLEWTVERYEISSQDEEFWEQEYAADMARRAHHAREIVEPASELLEELVALEELATESYFDRSFALSNDLDEQLAALAPRVEDLMVTLLRSVYVRPDRVALLMPPVTGVDADWRAEWIELQRERARRRGWRARLWRGRRKHERSHLSDEIRERGRGPEFWVRLSRRDNPPPSVALALEFEGDAARAVMTPEEGLHRLVDPEGNAVFEILLDEPEETIVAPESIERGSANPDLVRVWNRRTHEIVIPALDRRVDWTDDDLWARLEESLEPLVWAFAEDRELT